MSNSQRLILQRAAEAASISANHDRKVYEGSHYYGERLMTRGYDAASSAALSASMCLVHASDDAVYSAAANSIVARTSVGHDYEEERAWQMNKILQTIGEGGRS